jgi:hypothetical protein
LRRVDAVVVDAPKRLGDGNVLDEEDDDRYGQLGRKGRQDLLVDDRNAHGGEASRNGAQNRKARAAAVVHVDQPADHGVEQDDEGRTQRADKEEGALAIRIAARAVVARRADQVCGVLVERCTPHEDSQSIVSAVIPIAVSSFALCRFWRV